MGSILIWKSGGSYSTMRLLQQVLAVLECQKQDAELTPEQQALINSILAAQSKLAKLDARIAGQVSGRIGGDRGILGDAGTCGNGGTVYQHPIAWSRRHDFNNELGVSVVIHQL